MQQHIYDSLPDQMKEGRKMEEGAEDMLSMSVEDFGYHIKEKNSGYASEKGDVLV